MATKWRSIKYSQILKTIAFTLAIAFLTGICSITVYLVSNTNSSLDLDEIFETNYLKSKTLSYQLSDITSDIVDLAKEYKNEAYIKNGGTLKKDPNNYSWELRNLYREFHDSYAETLRNKDEEINPNLISEKRIKDAFEQEYKEEIAEYNNKEINNDLDEYHRLIGRISKIKGLYYYVLSENNEFTNSPNNSKDFFKSQPVYFLFDAEGQVLSDEINKNRWYYRDNLSYYPQDILYVALTKTYLAPQMEKWNQDREFIVPSLKLITLLGLGFIICILYLLFTVGRKADDEEIHLLFTDKIYLDLNFILSLIIVSLSIVFAAETFDNLEYYVLIPALLVSSILSINLLLSITKHIKNRTIFTHNLSYKIASKLLVKTFSYAEKLLQNAPLAVKMFPTPKKADNLKNIIEGIEQIKDGNLDYKIETSDKGIYGKIANDINNLTDGLKLAVQNELKSERLKTELISNVSHDIRTPLTSIITYVDLLKKEGLNSENGEKYLDILNQKSQRLKNLTDDLFEASKASSGNIPVNFEKVDIASLLTQGMGELNDKIKASGLDFKLKLPDEKIYVKADGKLLWRVLENLMSNIFKYALLNSRVYIDITTLDNKVSIIVKNISAYELDIDSKELMERFKRGDESRNSEGSGLGLSIAKSLIELQHGTFDIEIDGDLFKAIIILPQYKF